MDEVDEIILSCRDLLSLRLEFPLNDLRERAGQIVKPRISFRALSELTTLCLFYEDLLNRREEGTSKSLFYTILRELRERVDRYEVAVEFLDVKPDQIMSLKSCMAYVKQFHRRLLELERAIHETVDTA
jgi:hypothetical protein